MKVVQYDSRPITEARYLCPRMQKEFRQLERKYPGLIHHVHFEDFARNPISKSVEVDDHIGSTAPSQWTRFVQENMHSKKKGKYQVVDATETATEWQSLIPAADLREFDDLCGTF